MHMKMEVLWYPLWIPVTFGTTFIAQANYQVTHLRALKYLSEAHRATLSSSEDIGEAQRVF